jgi:hypothetical protein
MAGPTQLVEIERILSGERFRRYKAAARDDIALAIELYQINIEVSECVFGVLHLAEVCIRNSMHSALANYIGTPEWFRIGTVLPRTRKPIPYTAPMRDMVSKGIRSAGHAASPGKIVAELTFGFWTNLLSSKFQQPLWIPCLYKAFPNFGGHPRFLHRRMESLQRLRNRIAHHERVLTSNNAVYTGSAVQPYITPQEILQCVRWTSNDAASWTEWGTRFRHVIQLLDQFSKRGVQLP